jgi:hypothetical protein
MPVSKNTWIKGLNSDLSKLKTQQDSYLDAKNIRVITDEGESTFAVENIRGTKFNFKLPTVQATHFFSVVQNFTGTATITLQRAVTDPSTGLTFNDIVILQINNIEDKSYEIIANELNTALQGSNPPFTGNQYIRFYYNVSGIVLYDFKPQSEINWSSLNVSVTNLNYDQRTNIITSHVILGWGYYNDNLVLISCSSSSFESNPDNTEGFIWDVTYNNATGELITSQLDGDYLLPQTTLKYAGKLNLSRNYAISKHLKCRYESTEITRVVWTDWYNNLRTCNIADPQIWATPEELFSYLPQHLPQKPIISRIITGGTLPTGRYQYFYQLYSNQGAKSTYSPVSSLYNLFPGNLNTIEVTGSNPGVNSQKSIEVTLTNLDTNYDSIRIGYIVYQIADFPEAFFFDERPIPNSGQIILVHNGNENDIPVDSTEVANLNRPPEIFKTIDVVRNRLFAANALTKYFDPVFDARAYRFNSVSVADLYNDNDSYNNPSVQLVTNISGNIDVTIEGTVPPGNSYNQLLAIPDTFDLINPYNNEDNTQPLNNNDWINASQYKYKADGVTIGGQGPNISYEFIVETKLPKLAGLRQITPYIAPAMDGSTQFTSPFNDTYTYYGSANSAIDSMKNPYIESLFTGYARGEVYRFGIVFFDIYGYPSYTYWIGDIKFPLAYDNDGFFGLTDNKSIETSETYAILTIDPLYFNDQPGSEIKLQGQAIYNGNVGDIDEFVTDFNLMNTENLVATIISGNQIKITAPLNNVGFGELIEAVPTSESNITSAVFIGFSDVSSNLYTKQIGIKFTLDTNASQFQAIKNQITGWSYVRVKRDLDNSTRLGTGYMQPTFYVDGGTQTGYNLMPYKRIVSFDNSPYTSNRWNFDDLFSPSVWRTQTKLQTFYSPNFLLKRSGTFIAGDYMRMIGRTNNFGSLVQYSTRISTLSTWPGNTKLYYLASSDFNYVYTDLGNNPSIPFSEATSALDSTYKSKYTIDGSIFVTYSTTGTNIPAGTITGLDYPFYNMASSDSNEASMGNYMEWGAETQLISFNGLSSSATPDTSDAFNSTLLRLPIYLTSYERYLIDQYGGWLRSSRYNNEYILTNHFQPWDKNTSEALYQSTNGLVTNGVYGGDTYVNYFDWQRTNINYLEGSGWGIGASTEFPPFGLAVFFPCEASFNTELNVSYQHASVRANTAAGSNTITGNNYIYNSALSQQNTTNIFISKAFNQTNVKYEPHTIYGTEPKLDNERLDSWREFLLNNALTVNGNYGEINRLVQFKDRLFYYQNDAFGVASVDERVLAQEGDTSQTQLGTGTLLQRFDYVSTETGSKHSFAVEATGSAIYHYDAFINKLFRYSTSKDKDGTSSVGVSPLTDIKGLSGFFRTAFIDTELKSRDKITLNQFSRVGISTGYNSEYNTIYFTFFAQYGEDTQVNYTIAYNELLDAFESFYDFHPSLYINMRKRFLSINPLQPSEVYSHNLGLRNTFYNNTYPSYIKFRINENSDFVKTFDNFHINTEVIDVATDQQLNETITSYGITNDYQIVNERIANFTEKIRTWRLQIPRDETNPNLNIKPRMSDKYIDVLFKHTINGGDKIFRLHDVLTEYSMRSKILPR